MRLKCLGLVAGLAVGIAPGATAAPIASIHVEGTRLIVQPLVGTASLRVTVTGPQGLARSQVLEGGEAALELGEPGHALADGDYFYEARLLRSVADGGDLGDVVQRTGEDGVLSGAFAVRSGRASPSPAQAPPSRAAEPPPSTDAQVINDDLLVNGRLCAGPGCSTATFLTEDLQLRSTSNRIRADDTGTGDDDWQISFNDPGVGGVDRFSVENLSRGLTPFTIAGSAPNNALFVDGSGKVGFGTSTPLKALHVVSSVANAFEPRLRLEAAGGGFWDLGRNIAGFAVANGSPGGSQRNVLFLYDGAPHISLVLDSRGYFALGGATDQPEAPLHVKRNDSSAKLLVEEGSSPVIGRNLLQLKNNGPVTLRFDNASNGTSWGFGSIVSGNKFFMSASGAPSLSMTLDPSGNMTIAGALTQSSDRNAKDDIAAVDPAEVLAKLAELPIATWRYKGDDATHVGPMAQDFHAAFGLGPDDKHIAPADLAGLSLAAVQALRDEQEALRAEVLAKDARIQEQEALLHELAGRLAAIEGRLRASR